MKKLIHILILSLTLLGTLTVPAFADGGEPTPTKPPTPNLTLNG